MKKIKISVCALSLMLFTAISASCENTQTGTSLQFAFSGNSAESQNSQKSIYTKKETDSLNLNAKLEIDSGTASIQITNAESEDVIWESLYSESDSFLIELNDLQADSEYIINFTAKSSRANLIITCPESLLEEKTIPDKPSKS